MSLHSPASQGAGGDGEAADDLDITNTVPPTWKDDLRSLLRIGLPVVVVNLNVTAMQFTDAFMIARLGTEELAAITPPALVFFLLHSFGYGFFSATTTFVSQALGRREAQLCGSLAWQSLYLSLCSGLVVGALLPWTEHIFRLYHNESIRVLQLEIVYFQVICVALMPMMASMAISNFFIGVQRSAVVIVSSTVALVSNVLLNYGLIFGAWGLPEMGFVGAAWGTLGATVLESLLLLVAFLAPSNARSFGTWRCRPRVDIQAQMLRVGLPAGGQGALDVASWGLYLSWLAAFFGTSAQAAATVVIRCMQLAFVPADGIGVATLTLVGHAVGRRDLTLASRRAAMGFVVIGGFMVSIGAFLFLFRTHVLMLFSVEPGVISIGASALVIVAAVQFFDALNVNYVHALQAVGDTRWPLKANLLVGAFVLIGGGAYVVGVRPEIGIEAVWVLIAIYMCLLGSLLYGRWAVGAWKDINLFAEIEKTGER